VRECVWDVVMTRHRWCRQSVGDVQYMCRFCAALCAQDSGYSPLWNAVANDRQEVARLLIARGANVVVSMVILGCCLHLCSLMLSTGAPRLSRSAVALYLLSFKAP
jgi:hypothetical protein